MKKIICLFIIVCMCATLCACAPSPSSPEDEVIGYVIIPHADGDEHADITGYYYSSGGTLKVYCVDGRTIISNRITVILE
jgi:hypothetical protein